MVIPASTALSEPILGDELWMRKQAARQVSVSTRHKSSFLSAAVGGLDFALN